MDETVSLQAKLEKVIFRANDSNYFVGAFTNMEDKQEFTGTGSFSNIKSDTVYELEGRYVVHPRYGKQLAIISMQQHMPKRKDSTIKFLSGSQFPGVGEKAAKKITEALGEDALSKIQEDPEVLETIGLSSAQVESIQNGMAQYGYKDKFFMELLSYGIPEQQLQALKKRFQGQAEEVVEQNPFEAYFSVPRFSYASAQKVADARKMPAEDQRRMEAYVYKAFQELIHSSGGTRVQDSDLFSYTKLVNFSEYHEAVQSVIDRGLIYYEDGLYPATLFHAENVIAKLLHKHDFKLAPLSEDLDVQISRIEEKNAIEYDSLQKEAIKQFFTHSVMVLNGGPGTGKSTTVLGILDLIGMEFPGAQVQLAAPTGRASKRLSQLSHNQARTIHSLLKYDMENGIFRTEASDLCNTDFLIVDEFSMVDTWLMANLLKALPADCRILMIGDEDQLPSVSPGQVFNDIIDSKCVAKVSLQTLFRQSAGSGIALLASQIRKEHPLEYKDGVTFYDLPPEDIAEKVMELIQESDHPESVQILAPKYSGAAGIDAINEAMQEYLNPFSPSKSQLAVGKFIFREGDKVLLKRNRSMEHVYNGDIGEIIEVDVGGKTVVVSFDDDIEVPFTASEISDDLVHAWCISIHKSQGSEFQHVILVVDPSARFFLEKRLLYTGVSRAKKQLDLVGSKEVFEQKACMTSTRPRYTGLRNRLRKEWKGELPDEPVQLESRPAQAAEKTVVSKSDSPQEAEETPFAAAQLSFEEDPDLPF